MPIFEQYADFYDLFYQDKDYTKEAEFTHQLIQSYSSLPQSVIDFGCGTGGHAEKLLQYGYNLCGIDLSPRMLEFARRRIDDSFEDQAAKMHFVQGDIRTVRTGKTFDVAIALFHVMSYQITNADLQAALKTVKAHLEPGGVFIFDCWYGPAVLTERPKARFKEFKDKQGLTVMRFAEPEIHAVSNCVDVNYLLLVSNKEQQGVKRIKETHVMRYLFSPEIEVLAEQSGFSVLASAEWMTNSSPDFASWHVYFVLKNEC